MLLLCLLVCESCVAKKDQGRRPRGVCLSCRPRRAGDRSAVCLGFWCAPAFARGTAVLAVLDTSGGGKARTRLHASSVKYPRAIWG